MDAIQPISNRALEAAIWNRKSATAVLLLRPGPMKASARTVESWLRHAAEGGEVEILELLLRSYPRVATTQVLHRCVVAACTRRCCEVVSLLLAHGADADAACEHSNMFLLHYVMSRMYPTKDDTQILKILLEHGANVHARDGNGETPLAVVHHRRRTAQTLHAMVPLVQAERLLRQYGAIQ